MRTGDEAGEVTEQHDERAPDDPALERVGPFGDAVAGLLGWARELVDRDGRVIARATATVRMIQLPGA